MKRTITLVGLSVVFFLLLAAPSHPEYIQRAVLDMENSYAQGETIEIAVTNISSEEMTIPETGQCHSFFEIFQGNFSTLLQLTDPSSACTMEFRTMTILPGERKVLGTWNQYYYADGYNDPICTGDRIGAYPRFCEPVLADPDTYTASIHILWGETEVTETMTHSFTITNTVSGIFSDVPTSYWAYDHIIYLYNEGIAQGYGDGRFRPENHITNAEMVKMALNAASISLITYIRQPDPVYDDVPQSHSLFSYIDTAHTLGLIPDATRFNPDEPASRFFTLQLLIDALGLTPAYDTDVVPFADVESETEMLYVGFAKSAGIVSGYGDGTFGPDDPVKRSEMAKIIHNTVEQ